MSVFDPCSAEHRMSQHVVWPLDCPDDRIYLRKTAMWCSCISESLLVKQFAALQMPLLGLIWSSAKP
eukprot:2589256-Pleurochrysis_carterae.AAC.1